MPTAILGWLGFSGSLLLILPFSRLVAFSSQTSVFVPWQGASYKKPFHCCDVFWLPETSTLWQSPHKHMSPVISRRSILQVACVSLVYSQSHPQPDTFYEKVQGLDLILFDYGPYPTGTSMAQQLPINAHHFTHKRNIIYQQEYELHRSMFFRAQIYPPWYS